MVTSTMVIIVRNNVRCTADRVQRDARAGPSELWSLWHGNRLAEAIRSVMSSTVAE